MENLERLVYYFPTGTAEGERHILAKAFIQPEDLEDLITPPPYSPRIIVGKKGSGKSAIIDFCTAWFNKSSVPSLILKPKDFDYDKIKESVSVGEATRIAYKELCTCVAKKIGSGLSGYLNSQDQKLYDSAVKDGLIEGDSISKLAGLLMHISKPLISVDLSGLMPGTEKTTQNQLQRALGENLKLSEKGFFLFLDDTDQVAIPEVPGQLNRIWGFLLAARDFCQNIPQVRCFISLREEVWRRLTSDKAGQRDQTDHFVNLVRYLNPTREHIRKIINRRVFLAGREISDFDEPWQLFFLGESPKMPMSSNRSSWIDLIVNRSRERPRDAVQLIYALASYVKSQNRSRITEEDFAKVMVMFSGQRAKLLAQEVEFECPQLLEIINSLSEINYEYDSFKATADDIRAHIKKLEGRFGITLFGAMVRPSDDDGLFAIWRFLFDHGVINARISDITQKDGYRHIYPSEDPNIVTKARWNDMQKLIWEIGPAYRDHLISIQKAESHRRGLPPTSRKKYYISQ